MKNTILNFTLEELDQFIVPDYRSKNIDVYTVLDYLQEQGTLNDYINTIRINENDKLERLSYSLYSTTDYWDIILIINELNPLFDMYYDNDTVIDSTTEEINYYANNVYSNSPLNEIRTNSLIDEFIEINKTNNEKFSYLKVVKPTKMGDFMKILRDKDYV